MDAVAGIWTRPQQIGSSRQVADFNADDLVSPQDIFDFLVAYFSGSTETADINGDGVLAVQDLFDFLAAYFAA